MKPTMTPDRRAAWREPMLWLVAGGPALVVVASLATAVLAWRGHDALDLDARVAQESSRQPALKARNHAATPRDAVAARP